MTVEINVITAEDLLCSRHKITKRHFYNFITSRVYVTLVALWSYEVEIADNNHQSKV